MLKIWRKHQCFRQEVRVGRSRGKKYSGQHHLSLRRGGQFLSRAGLSDIRVCVCNSKCLLPKWWREGANTTCLLVSRRSGNSSSSCRRAASELRLYRCVCSLQVYCKSRRIQPLPDLSFPRCKPSCTSEWSYYNHLARCSGYPPYWCSGPFPSHAFHCTRKVRLLFMILSLLSKDSLRLAIKRASLKWPIN